MHDPSAAAGFAVIGAVVVALSFVIAWCARAAARRLPRAAVVSYVPPDGDVLTHALMARADRQSIAATLVGLATRGAIRILSRPGDTKTLAIEVRTSDLRAHEYALIDALMPQKLSERESRRYDDALRQLGVLVSPDAPRPQIAFLNGPAAFTRKQRARLSQLLSDAKKRIQTLSLAKASLGSLHLVALSLLFLGTLVIGVLLALPAAFEGSWVIVAILLATIAGTFWAIVIAPPPMLRFTASGQELRRELSALRDYMKVAEADRMRMLQSREGALRTPAGALTPAGAALGLTPQPTENDPVAQSTLDRVLLLERLLPYAVIFGLEDSWRSEYAHLGGEYLTHNLDTLGSTIEGVVVVVDTLTAIAHATGIIRTIFLLGVRLFD